MAQYCDFLYARTEWDRIQQLLQRITRLTRALAVVLIGAQSHHAPRRPGEKDGYDGRFRILNDLCKTISSFIEAIVESMHEDHRLAAAGRFGDGSKGGVEARPVQILGGGRHELAMRISRWGRRPLDFANLARV